MVRRHREAVLPDAGESWHSAAMIIRPRPTAFALRFILRGSILPIIAPQLLTLLLVSGAVVSLRQAAPYYLRDAAPRRSRCSGWRCRSPRVPQQRRLRTLPGGPQAIGLVLAPQPHSGLPADAQRRLKV